MNVAKTFNGLYLVSLMQNCVYSYRAIILKPCSRQQHMTLNKFLQREDKI